MVKRGSCIHGGMSLTNLYQDKSMQNIIQSLFKFQIILEAEEKQNTTPYSFADLHVQIQDNVES